MTKLSELVGCGHGWAEERAQLAQDIIAQRNSGDITPAEARELLEDLIATDKLNEVADDMAIKAALISAINIASKVM